MNRLRVGFIVLLLFLLLALRFFFFFQSQTTYHDGQKLSFATRITEEPQVKFGNQQFRVRVGNGEKVTIITGLKPLLQYGDRIKISGVISQRDYKGHIFSSISNPDLQIDTSDQNFISAAATGIRRFTTKFFQENLPPVSSGLLTGIIFGGNQGLPDKFMQNLRVSGVVHVIAASGMNVTFVASALIAVLGAVFKRQIALTIAIFGIVFYAFVSGFEPSIVRAAIMSILAFSASLLGRQNFALASIFITGFIMLLISPFLISDIGFQLSFLATLGILVVKPLLDGGLSREARSGSARGGLGKLLGGDLTTTIAAQVATLPILLATFGSYGLLSVLVNALVLWTVPVLMFLGAIGLIAGFLFEPLGKLILFLSEPILFFFEKVVSYFGNLGWTLTIPEVSSTVWIGYYLLLSAIIFLIRKIRTKSTLKREIPSNVKIPDNFHDRVYTETTGKNRIALAEDLHISVAETAVVPLDRNDNLVKVPQGLIDEITSITAPKPRIITEYERLSPSGQRRADIMRTVLSESGVRIVGLREVHPQRGVSQLDIFIAGDRRGDVIGGKLHTVFENGRPARHETIVSVPFNPR